MQCTKASLSVSNTEITISKQDSNLQDIFSGKVSPILNLSNPILGIQPGERRTSKEGSHLEKY